MSCRQLAMAGRFLAHLGRNPPPGYAVVHPERARRINAVMLTCGHYDGSGEFAYRVGLPGKSGVGGGILAVVPGKASIAVWSPGLDANGNSHLGRIALEASPRRWAGRSLGREALVSTQMDCPGSSAGTTLFCAPRISFADHALILAG